MRILYLDLDSLRPDHLGCYGYGRPTSPTLDALAGRGVRFTRFFASDSPCVPSRAALFSGRPGIRNGVVTHETTPAGCAFRYGHAERYGGSPTLGHALIDAGLQTATFTSFADRHAAGWFTFGMREVHLVSMKGGNEDAPEVNDKVLPWLRANAAKDGWFVHVNYWDAHTLYTEPAAYFDRMAALPPGRNWPDAAAVARHARNVGVRTARTLWGDHPHDGFGKSRVPTMPDAIRSTRDVQHLLDGYDGGIRYADDHVAALLDELDRQGVLDDTVVVVSADHGEAFGELGQYAEHGSVSPATHRLPLIVAGPVVSTEARGTACDAVLLNTDLAATFVDLAGGQVPTGWTGRSFADALHGRSARPVPEPVVWTHGLHTRQRAVYDGRWLFVRTYHPSWYAYPPRMLFDLVSDPHQENDVAGEYPSLVDEFGAFLTDWERQQVRAAGQPDPMRLAQNSPPAAGQVDAYVGRLRREARQDAADALVKRLAKVDADYAPPPLGGI